MAGELLLVTSLGMMLPATLPKTASATVTTIAALPVWPRFADATGAWG